ncbi:hypothetical protein DUNSADRAFT_4395 [Dunaliella salina]|uniref:Uncharacterized protein n=1 Tax=Dunaliella salina TaxID=3046 RepID=A0ABQ7GS43_DUNSA|nr:hypothetical protein DUNSADRAFT_4395 [Dunaliella salina]|eukprot:KAF5837415.1 hypothetical protein DUNSADRAFT_4395 [Dunaliella salina]
MEGLACRGAPMEFLNMCAGAGSQTCVGLPALGCAIVIPPPVHTAVSQGCEQIDAYSRMRSKANDSVASLK